MAFTLPAGALLGIRAAQAIFSIIVLGTMGYTASVLNNPVSYRGYYGRSPSQVNFMIFTAVWTLLVLVYLVVVPMRFSGTIMGHGFLILGIEAVTMIFWFAGFIACAVLNPIGAFAAGTAFGAFTWLLFLITTVFAAMHVFSNRGSSGPKMHNSGPGVTVQEGV